MTLATKLTNIFSMKKVNFWSNLFLGLTIVSAYFIGALDFQLIEADKISSPLLVVGTVLGLTAGMLLVAPVISYKFVLRKYGINAAVINIILIIVFTIIALVAIVVGTMAYLQK